MFNLRSTEDCDPDDDLLNEFLNCDDPGEGILSGIDHVSNKELPIQSEPSDGASRDSATLLRGGGDRVPSNDGVPSDDRKSGEFADASTHRQTMNSATTDELNRLFEDEDNQYSSNLINDQLILNSKVSDR